MIEEVYELYGFEPVEQPLIEYTDALGKFLPDQDRPGEGVFSFQDDDDQWLSLRYDLTAPLARYVAENYDRLPKPYRSYRQGWVFRNEKPGPGRYRQFMQFDADTVGTVEPRRRCRSLHDGCRYARTLGHRARPICDEGRAIAKFSTAFMETFNLPGPAQAMPTDVVCVHWTSCPARKEGSNSYWAREERMNRETSRKEQG